MIISIWQKYRMYENFTIFAGVISDTSAVVVVTVLIVIVVSVKCIHTK